MYSYFKKNDKLLESFTYIFALFIILDGNSMYHSLANVDLHFSLICMVILLLILVVNGSWKLELRSVRTAGFFLFYSLTYFLVKIDTINRGTYLAMVIGIPALIMYFWIMQELDRKELLFYCMENIIIILSCISLFLWVFGEVLNVLNPNMSATVTWGQLRTYQGFFGVQFMTTLSNSFGKGLYINSGLFTEGPMFCMWLCFALITELFLREKQRGFIVLLFIVTIFTTLSTFGIFFAAFSLALKYVTTFRKRIGLKQIILTTIIIIFIPVLITFLQYIFSLKAGTTSYSIRTQDYVAGFLLWKNNPILGSGYGNITSLQRYVLASRAGNVGFSNSLSAILGTGGLWNFVPYVCSLIIPLGNCNKGNINRKCFFISYFVISIFLIFFSRFIMAVFWAYAFSQLSNYSEYDDSSKLNLEK